jgi:hypothetical protein
LQNEKRQPKAEDLEGLDSPPKQHVDMGLGSKPGPQGPTDGGVT